ncbi:hypothetical protein OX284_004850 [Flavobacterium sp. SUN046]|uniref:hypothetical protein n=1 Tax=Flavobacterium sp. SUN046 TaxID=3002440 RepID=UPI002DB67E57|nr:hypothetical protein [Flavobacterium sp. SUN046]MEC4048749.1 hypothetical protein [Flavobacterium sp. SUN046]
MEIEIRELQLDKGSFILDSKTTQDKKILGIDYFVSGNRNSITKPLNEYYCLIINGTENRVPLTISNLKSFYSNSYYITRIDTDLFNL